MNSKRTNKFIRFLQNNMVLLISIMCVLAITAVVLIATLSNNDTDVPVVKDPDDNVDEPVNPPQPTDPVVIKKYFATPVEYTSIGMEFTNKTDVLFVFNQTLNKWKVHKAVDLVADDGAVVSSMYDGTVIDVSTSYGMGNSVTIDHGNGIVATYASLAEVQVVEGQVVTSGDKIGTVGVTANNEFLDGAHVHLEIRKDNVEVDPMPYVNGEIFFEVEQ